MIKLVKRIQSNVVSIWKWIMRNIVSLLVYLRRIVKCIRGYFNTTLFCTLLATVFGGLAVNYIYNEMYLDYKFKSKPFLTFESDNTQVFYLSKRVDRLEYSVGEDRWHKLSTQSIVFGGINGALKLRGVDNYKGTDGATIVFGTDAEVVCTGDVYTLVDYRHYDSYYKKDNISSAKFNGLFENCKQLVVAPDLHSKVLSDSCYESMFSGCVSLKRAPELPAERLKSWCYSNMFRGCTSLKKSPIISAKLLEERSCSGMFTGCVSLEEAPELGAEYLAKNCYSNMFEGCTSLKVVQKELPAGTLKDACYLKMFENCTSLIKAPDLPAMTLSQNCYSNMFKNCKNLVNAPILPATDLAESCYTNMFFGCISLEQITMLAKTINKNQFSQWLDNASSNGLVFKNKEATWEDKDILPSGWETVLYEKK